MKCVKSITVSGKYGKLADSQSYEGKRNAQAYFRNIKEVVEDVEFETVKRSDHFINMAFRQIYARNCYIRLSLDSFR